MFEVGSRVLYHAHDRLDFNATTCCGLSNSYHHCMYWWMRIHLVWRENFLIEKSSGQQRGNVSWRRLGCFNQFEESPTCSSEYGCQSTSVFLRVHLSLNWASCATEHRGESPAEAVKPFTISMIFDKFVQLLSYSATAVTWKFMTESSVFHGQSWF